MGGLPGFQVKLLTRAFNIIMWDVLSADFDIHLNPEKCARNVIKNAKGGLDSGISR